MADQVDLQRLVVSLEASVTKFERSMQRANQISDQAAGKIERRFEAMSGKVGASAARGLQPLGLQTANIAAQFQDIAVQLQGGASPFTIALQQGTQLSAALGSGGGGLKGALGALVGGFASLVNPISLATVATIALGGAAVQYFGTLIQDGRVSEETLKKQEDLIRSIADKWGEVVPALREYVTRLDAAASAGQAQEAQAALVSRAWQEVRSSVSATQVDVVDLVSTLRTAGAPANDIAELQQAFADLDGKVKAGTASAADAQRVSAALANLMNTASTPAVRRLADTYSILASAIAAAQAQAASAGPLGNAVGLNTQATQKFIDEQTRLNRLTTEQLKLETEIGRVRAEAERGGANLTDEQALSLARERLAAEERRSQITAGAPRGEQASKAADQEAKAVLELIRALEFEGELVGKSEVEQAQMNAVRQAGAAATSEQRQQIEQLVAANFAARQSVDEVAKGYEQMRDIGETALSTFISGVRQGKSATDALADSLNRVADRLLDMAITSAFDAIFPGAGTVGGGLFKGLFGGHAAGGFIRGPGTGKSDSIPARLSNGEFVVNARATSRNRGLLEAINSRGYADGGLVPTPESSSPELFIRGCVSL